MSTPGTEGKPANAEAGQRERRGGAVEVQRRVQRTEGDILSTFERLFEHFVFSSMAVQPASCRVEAAVQLVLLLRLQVLLLRDNDELVRVERFLNLVEVGICSDGHQRWLRRLAKARLT